jgi:hypothetical protein
MGTVGIAYDEADEATARVVASWLEHQGENVKLMTSSTELNALDRVIIIWSRASLKSPQLYDIARLFEGVRHAIIGNLSANELPVMETEPLLLVVGENGALTPRYMIEQLKPSATRDGILKKSRWKSAVPRISTTPPVPDTSNYRRAVRLGNWLLYAWLVVFAMCPILTLLLPVFGYTREVNIDEAINSSIDHWWSLNVVVLPWFIVFWAVCRSDIGRSWPNHKLAVHRMIGALAGLCIPLSLMSFAVAEQSLLAAPPPGLVIAAMFILLFFVTPFFGFVGMLMGWLSFWISNRYTQQPKKG